MSDGSNRKFYSRYNLHYPVQIGRQGGPIWRPVVDKEKSVSRGDSDKVKMTNIFTEIYQQNAWGSSESRSGLGSELMYTENVRRMLPVLFEEFGVRSVLDAPCGDFNWMSKVVEATSIRYIGGDIVPELVNANRLKRARGDVGFVELDVCSDPLPLVDLWICRDCLFHFPYREIYHALANFAKSGIRFLLTSTHVNDSTWHNYDIAMGEFRYIDLFSSPFFLPKEVLFSIDDYVPPFPHRQLVLFDKSMIAQALPRFNAALG